MDRCRLCVLPKNFPHVTFDSDGVCSLCRAYKGNSSESRARKKYGKKIRELASRIRGKNDYDVLMCYSGGKDSTYTMGLLKNKYRLNVLAFTVDNGFFADRAYVNMRNAVEYLGIDHVIFKPNFRNLQKVFKTALKRSMYPEKAMERASAICTSCIGIVKYASLRCAIEKCIPLVAFGWSPGQAPVGSSILKFTPDMLKKMQEVIRKPIMDTAGKEAGAYFLNEKCLAAKVEMPAFIHPLTCEDYDEKKIIAAIKKFGWEKPHDTEMNATNCLLNILADSEHIKKYKFHPYLLEIAAFVRQGIMTRNEGLAHLPVRKDRKVISGVKKRLGIK
jgi:hypothetical protein